MELLPEDETVLHRKDIGRVLYFVLSGTVRMWSSDEARISCELGAGAYFGEAGFLYNVPRLCTIRTKTPCQILCLSYEQVHRTFEDFPAYSLELRRLCTDRKHLRQIHEAIIRQETKSRHVSPLTLSQQLALDGVNNQSSSTTRVRTKWQHLIVLPSSRFAKYWEHILIVIALMLAITIPLQAAFFPDAIGLMALHYALEIPFLLDVVLKTRTGGIG